MYKYIGMHICVYVLHQYVGRLDKFSLTKPAIRGTSGCRHGLGDERRHRPSSGDRRLGSQHLQDQVTQHQCITWPLSAKPSKHEFLEPLGIGTMIDYGAWPKVERFAHLYPECGAVVMLLIQQDCMAVSTTSMRMTQIDTLMCIYIYVYMYRGRERERERETHRQGGREGWRERLRERGRERERHTDRGREGGIEGGREGVGHS